jgi:hypothetical protein
MALAFYPLVAWRAWLMPPAARGQGLVRRPAPRAAPRRPPRWGPPSPSGDRQRCRFGAAWSKSERAVIVVQKELCAQEVCSERAAPGYGVYRHRNRA